MEKFCTKCGKPLIDGKCGFCQIPNREPAMEYQNVNQDYQSEIPPMRERAEEKKESYLNKAMHTFMMVLKEPASQGRQFVNCADYTMAFVFMGVQAILTTLFTVIILSKIFSASSKLIDTINALINYAIDVEWLKVPYSKIVIVTLLISIALNCILALILWAFNNLFKRRMAYQQMLCLVSIRSVALIPVIMASIVLLYLNLFAGVALFCSGNILGLCYLMTAHPEKQISDRNKNIWILFLSSLLFIIISGFIMTKGIPFYIPDAIKEGIESVKSYLENSGQLLNLLPWY
ncbi:MAG: hypothetical protein RSB37_09150 [Acetivibrio sp.]